MYIVYVGNEHSSEPLSLCEVYTYYLYMLKLEHVSESYIYLHHLLTISSNAAGHIMYKQVHVHSHASNTETIKGIPLIFSSN